jgi:hypothetical protein
LAFSWFVYTTLSTRDAQTLEEGMREALDQLLRERPGLIRGAEWGDVNVEADLPAVDDVVELSEAYDRPVSDEVLDRLESCRSAISVERAQVSDLDPLQVSILQYLVERAGPCLVDWGDMQIVLSEDVLTEIAEYPSAGRLGEPYAGTPAGAERAQRPLGPVAGLDRAAQTERAIELVSEKPFKQRRYLRMLEKLPEFAQNYVRMLSESGAVGDVEAAAKLGVTREELEPALAKLHKVTTGLADLED